MGGEGGREARPLIACICHLFCQAGRTAGDSKEAAPWISLSAGDSGRQLRPSWAPGSWGQSRHKGQVHGAGHHPTPGPCVLALGAQEGPAGGSRDPCPGACSALQWWESGPALQPALCGLSQGSLYPPSPSPLYAQVPKRGEPVAWASPKTEVASKLSFPFYSYMGGTGPKGRAPAEEARLSGAPLAHGGTCPPLQSSGCVACSSGGLGLCFRKVWAPSFLHRRPPEGF